MQTMYVLCLLVASSSAASIRSQRDVSHLPLEYLPPLPAIPSRDYLPPVEEPQAARLESIPEPSRDYLPPVEPAALKLNNEYLPPAVPTTTEPTTTTTTTEASTTTEEIVVTTTTEAAVEEPATEALPEPEPELKTHEPVLSAVLESDGYHYRTPDVVPDLSPAQPLTEAEELAEELPTRDYLPPLEDNAVVAEGPENDESAALLDDGYHYRAIRRL